MNAKRKVIRGYTQVPNTVLLDCRLTSDARFIYALLVHHSRPGKEQCWPGQERLAQLCRWQTKTGQPNRWRVQRALKELEGAGLIGRERGGTRRSNTYFLKPVPKELLALELETDGQVAESLPAVMRNSQGKVPRKSASQQCASDAHRSEADSQHEHGGLLRNGAQQGNGDQNALSPSFPQDFSARRSSSSLRGVGGSSSGGSFEKDFDQKYSVRAVPQSCCKQCRAPGQWPYGYCDACRREMARRARGAP
jgi:hypothetical protein